jgi:ATP-dependent phosphofructokinase / diphosphate-dependent phosphofructokinase
VLGHVRRGGSPTAFDRILSTRFGGAAVDLIAQGGFGKMVASRQQSAQCVDIREAIGQLRVVDREGELVRTAKSIGIHFGEPISKDVMARGVGQSLL